MDTRTNELIANPTEEQLKNPDVKLIPNGRLAKEASDLMAKGQFFAPRGSELDKWAAQKRRAKKNRKKNKMGRASRKRNRK